MEEWLDLFTTEVSDGFAKLNMLLLKAVGDFLVMSAETLGRT